MSDRLHTDYAHLPLTADERDTCMGLLASDPLARMTIMPNHAVDAFGNLGGFVFDTDAGARGTVLPVARRMFFGHSATFIDEPEGRILSLMSQHAENRARMLEFLQALHSVPVERHATLDCVPLSSQASCFRSVDAAEWVPEPPECIGLYHAYLRGFNRDVRAHRLLVVCSGGLPRACDEFANLVIDVGPRQTCADVASSVEAWWLRKACARSRARLMCMLADAFGLNVPRHEDIFAKLGAARVSVARPVTDTVEHDLTLDVARSRVRVLNSCCDTTRPFNGMLCRMHPAEGFWLFRGARHQDGSFGSVFGGPTGPGAFPVSQCALPRASPHSVLATGLDDCIVRLDAARAAPLDDTFMCFDHAYMQRLHAMRWEADFGHVELMPIVVGLS